MDNSIGNKVQKLREDKGWSRKKLAQKICLSESSIKDIEYGNNKLNNMKTVNKILDIFDISFDCLFEDILIASQNQIKNEFEKELDFELSQMNIKSLELVDDIINAFIQYEKNK